MTFFPQLILGVLGMPRHYQPSEPRARPVVVEPIACGGEMQENKARQKPQDDREQSADNRQISEREVEEVQERSSPRAPVIYEIVRKLGEEEMARPATSLWWSGVAAGLSISFGLLAQAILYTHLPDAPWRPLVAS